MKLVYSGQISEPFPNIKLQENSFSGSLDFLCGRKDIHEGENNHF
jgi:hypothetical protein